MGIFDDIGEGIADAADVVLDVGEGIGDVAGDIADALGDAGDEIGGVLKMAAPVIAFFPGIGTGISVAIYAAGAAAAGDTIEEATIGTVLSAAPPGPIRIALSGGINAVTAIAKGQSVLGATLDTMKQTAYQVSPEAGKAFEAGVNLASGGNVGEAALQTARGALARQGDASSLMAFDAGVGIIKGKPAGKIALDVGRAYIEKTQGPQVVAAYDVGVALAYGKTLQEAGYQGLKSFVSAWSGGESVESFTAKVGQANALGIGVDELLKSELAGDFIKRLKVDKIPFSQAKVVEIIRPYADRIVGMPVFSQMPSGMLAQLWNAPEPYVRAAQAVVRTGKTDQALLASIQPLTIRIKIEGGVEYAADKKEIDGWVAKGRAIEANPFAVWRSPLQREHALRDIRNGKVIWVSGQELGKWNGHPTNALWQRGFDAGIGIAEGRYVTDATQDRIRNALSGRTFDGKNPKVIGFMAAQQLQFARTKRRDEVGAIGSMVSQVVKQIQESPPGSYWRNWKRKV